jgi:hypothetical protein
LRFGEFLIYSVTDPLSLRVDCFFEWLMPFDLLLLCLLSILLCLFFLFFSLLFIFLCICLAKLLLCLLFNFFISLFLCSSSCCSVFLFLCLLPSLLEQTWERIDWCFRTINIFLSIYSLSLRVVFFEQVLYTHILLSLLRRLPLQ